MPSDWARSKRVLRARDWLGMALMVTLLPTAGFVVGLWLLEVVL
jgi:hypothetical protein